MNRRDTIIVAVLVNAALLMILFATAVRPDKTEAQSKKHMQLAKTPAIDPAAEEDLFNQYASSVPTLADTHVEPISFTEEIELTYTPPQPVEEKKVIEKPKSQSNARYADVIVKRGDFLEKIANANNTTVAAIMEANNMSSTQLKIGQVLKVPLSNSMPKQPSQPAEEGYYVIKEGDNPWLIASRNNLRLEELLRLNGLDEQKARRLRPGDRLRIR